MTMRASPDLPSGRWAGFTLVELLVVLAILGLAMALFAGRGPHFSSALRLRGVAADVAAGLRLARSQAIASDRAVAFELDLRHHRYRAGPQNAVRSLPGEFALELTTIAGDVNGTGDGAIVFNPDGTSSGGRISIADPHRRVVIGVEWLTGRVSVADAL